MSNGLLLQVDDEVESLRAYIIFFRKKERQAVTVSNGPDAIDQCRQRTLDLVPLDEMMPGPTGLETLQRIREISPATPVVMVIKSEEENVMGQVIDSEIADYPIKSVNPSQISLTLKKNIRRKEIVMEVTQSGYQRSFQGIFIQIMNRRSLGDWIDIYKRSAHRELELGPTDSSMTRMLQIQREEVDLGFAKYIKQYYLERVVPSQTSRPMVSPDLFKDKIFSLPDAGKKVFLTVIGNLRYDQQQVISRGIGGLFDMREDIYVSVLSTATQYVRDAIFSGLILNKIVGIFPHLWIDEDKEENKNLNEEPLIRIQTGRYRRHHSFSYNKVSDSSGAGKFFDKLYEFRKNNLNVLVVSSVDMLSHARTESKVVRELVNNESAYRSIARGRLQHSMVTELIRLLSQSDCKAVLTTDHGSIRVSEPIKVISDRNTNTNLRYKLDENLSYSTKEVFTIKDLRSIQLPSPNISTSYVFATDDTFSAHPNNYNYYISYYKGTFQHGGISMEEMLVPLTTLAPRKR